MLLLLKLSLLLLQLIIHKGLGWVIRRLRSRIVLLSLQFVFIPPIIFGNLGISLFPGLRVMIQRGWQSTVVPESLHRTCLRRIPLRKNISNDLFWRNPTVLNILAVFVCRLWAPRFSSGRQFTSLSSRAQNGLEKLFTLPLLLRMWCFSPCLASV